MSDITKEGETTGRDAASPQLRIHGETWPGPGLYQNRIYAKSCIEPRPQGILIGFVSDNVHKELLKYPLHAQIIQKILDKNISGVSCRVKTCLNAAQAHFIYGTWRIKFRPSLMQGVNNISSDNPEFKQMIPMPWMQEGGETVFITLSLSGALSLLFSCGDGGLIT